MEETRRMEVVRLDEGGGPSPGAGRVLVVDDDDSVRETLYYMLVTADFEVTLASGGREALALLEAPEQLIDVAIFDMAMPHMDGLELLAEARRIRPHLPVLMLTGFGDFRLVMKALDAGVDDFLSKPITPDVLRSRVARVIEKARVRAERDALVERTLRLNQFLMQLHDASIRHGIEKDGDAGLVRVVGLVAKTLEVKRAALFILDSRSRTLRVAAAMGMAAKELDEVVLMPDQPPMAELFQRRRAEVLDLTECFAGTGRLWGGRGLAAVLCAPVIAGADTVGAFALSRLDGAAHFTEEDIRLVETAADHVGTIIHGHHQALREQRLRRDLRRAHESGHLALQREALLLGHVSEGVVLVERDLEVRLVNPALPGLLGRPHVAVGQPLSAALPELATPELLDAIDTIRRRAEPLRLPLGVDLATGEFRLLSVTLSALRGPDGRFAGAILLIGHAGEAPQQGRAARLLEAAALALRHPLEVVTRNRDRAPAHGNPQLTAAIERLGIIHRSLELLAADLAGEAPWDEPTRLDMASFLEDARRLGDIAARPQRVSVSLDPGDRPLPVRAAPEQLTLIATWLVLDAVDHAAPATTVRITARQRLDRVILRVTDSSEGAMDAQQAEFLASLGTTDTDSIDFAGLSRDEQLPLATVTTLTELLGGELWIDRRSRAGTTVTVTLPLAE